MLCVLICSANKMGVYNTGFWQFPGVLDGLGSSGRLVGIIPTDSGTSLTPWCRRRTIVRLLDLGGPGGGFRSCQSGGKSLLLAMRPPPGPPNPPEEVKEKQITIYTHIEIVLTLWDLSFDVLDHNSAPHSPCWQEIRAGFVLQTYCPASLPELFKRTRTLKSVGKRLSLSSFTTEARLVTPTGSKLNTARSVSDENRWTLFQPASHFLDILGSSNASKNISLRTTLFD